MDNIGPGPPSHFIFMDGQYRCQSLNNYFQLSLQKINLHHKGIWSRLALITKRPFWRVWLDCTSTNGILGPVETEQSHIFTALPSAWEEDWWNSSNWAKAVNLYRGSSKIIFVCRCLLLQHNSKTTQPQDYRYSADPCFRWGAFVEDTVQ